MDTMTRNQIFMENEEIITRVMRRNAPLLRALRLEWDDVYQELAVAMLNAINTFDPARSESLRAHIWMKLQYAVLDIKRRHSPHGMTAMGNSLSPQFYSVELAEEQGYPLRRMRSVSSGSTRPCPGWNRRSGMSSSST